MAWGEPSKTILRPSRYLLCLRSSVQGKGLGERLRGPENKKTVS